MRPAGAGTGLAFVYEARAPEEFCGPRIAPEPARAAAIWLAAALDDIAGGVMRLTVGRENALDAGRAPARALLPTLVSLVGLTFTRLKD